MKVLFCLFLAFYLWISHVLAHNLLKNLHKMMALVPKCAPGHSRDIHVCLDPGKSRYFEALTISSGHFCKNQRKIWIIDSFLPKVPLVKVQGLKIPGFTGDMTYIDISSLVIRTFWHQSRHFMQFYRGVLRWKEWKIISKKL